MQLTLGVVSFFAAILPISVGYWLIRRGLRRDMTNQSESLKDQNAQLAQTYELGNARLTEALTEIVGLSKKAVLESDRSERIEEKADVAFARADVAETRADVAETRADVAETRADEAHERAVREGERNDETKGHA